MRFPERCRERERGNVLVVSFMMVTLLTALATAHFATVQKNARQSDFLNDLGDLRRYAESGANLALHELVYSVGNSDGQIGTELWTTANDWGYDGAAGTTDEGEGDGIPTPGEPNLTPADIGDPARGIRVIVRTQTTQWPSIWRIVATAFNSRTMATIEGFAQEGVNSIPPAGAAYVQPGVAMDLQGNNFVIDGHDTNPDGTPGPEAAVYGISAPIGDPPGTNSSALAAQVPGGREDQVIGLGADPSIGETGALDFDSVFNSFKASRTNVVAPGTYANVAWGDHAANDYQVTYINGDVHLSGTGTGAGALVVEGSLTMTGTFTFVGIVIVRGDVRMSGMGANNIDLFGSMLIGQTMTVMDPDPQLGLTGNARIRYSSLALTKAAGLLGSNFTVLYWNDIK